MQVLNKKKSYRWHLACDHQRGYILSHKVQKSDDHDDVNEIANKITIKIITLIYWLTEPRQNE